MKKKILTLIAFSSLQLMNHKVLPTKQYDEIRQRALSRTGATGTPPILQRAANKIYSKDFYELDLNEIGTIIEILNFLTFRNSDDELFARDLFLNLAEEFIAFDMYKLNLKFKPVFTNLLDYLQAHASNPTDEAMLMSNYFFEKFKAVDSSEKVHTPNIGLMNYFDLINKIREDVRKKTDTDFDSESSEQVVFCNIL